MPPCISPLVPPPRYQPEHSSLESVRQLSHKLIPKWRQDILTLKSLSSYSGVSYKIRDPTPKFLGISLLRYTARNGTPAKQHMFYHELIQTTLVNNFVPKLREISTDLTCTDEAYRHAYFHTVDADGSNLTFLALEDQLDGKQHLDATSGIVWTEIAGFNFTALSVHDFHSLGATAQLAGKPVNGLMPDELVKYELGEDGQHYEPKDMDSRERKTQLEKSRSKQPLSTSTSTHLSANTYSVSTRRNSNYIPK